MERVVRLRRSLSQTAPQVVAASAEASMCAFGSAVQTWLPQPSARTHRHGVVAGLGHRQPAQLRKPLECRRRAAPAAAKECFGERTNQLDELVTPKN